MESIVVTNTQMYFSCLESSPCSTSAYCLKPSCSYGISNSRRPIFGVALKSKNLDKLRIYCLRRPHFPSMKSALKEDSDKGCVGGTVLDKELNFKPSFGEYLKAMETIRSVRDKRRANKSDGSKSNDKQAERDVDRAPMSGRDEDDVKLKKFEGFLKQENVFKDSKHDELLGIGDEVTTRKGEFGLGQKDREIEESDNELEVRKNGLDAGLKRSPGREFSYMGKSSQTRKAHETRVVRDSGENLGGFFDKNVKFDCDENTSWVLGKKGNLGGFFDKNVKFDRDENTSWVSAKKGKTFERDNIGPTRNKISRFSQNHIQVADEEMVQKRGRFTRSSRGFLQEDDDKDGSEMNRVAFKFCGELNDVSEKPCVSRREAEERIQKLAKSLNGADINIPEWMFSKMMRSAKIRFTDHSILRVIQILGKHGNWRRVLQVIDWLQMRERYKSNKLRHVYTAALDVLGKSRRPVEALNVFHAMQQHMSSYPDAVAYHSIAITLGQAGYIKELFDVIDIMRSPPKKKFKTGAIENWNPQVEPDIVVYNAVLNACVQRKQWEGAFWVLQQLKQQGQQPSATTYGLVMEVMLACGKYNLVHDFFRKLRKSYIPNALAYKVLVNTLWRENKVDEAVVAVQDMERKGILGSAALYYDLARCLCSAGRCKEALVQVEKICKVASKPLVVTYTGLIQACLDAGNIHDGVYIFDQMKDFCSPNLVTCNILLKAYLDQGLFEEARELFQKMSEEENHINNKADCTIGVIPDSYTFNTMLDASIKEKRWDEFEYVYRRMLDHGYHFNAKRHLSMLLDACRAGKEELLETTWKHLTRADRIPPPALVKERFCMKLEREDYVSAISCVTSQPVTELQAFSTSAWSRLFKDNAERFGKHSFIQLINEVNSFNGGSSSANLVLQNLLTACRNYVRANMTLAEIKLTTSL
ncbi:pentatricopeptide repeat-containing protein [Tripterygium wilfordii]|uniref:Pentatricopeptide repeat-containing protein n=1 Tax=Tripterygium wilfordii TaxID=458696 RepID=A0A7J7D7X4_TRIWF|nr:pentatricopeptide repeat-containing protein At1g30610, chloroplastic [Tripterygium wilfordii]KAF5742414.1 pentatricopeptide repeat-containing protein [Tripterygium wilfordii]